MYVLDRRTEPIGEAFLAIHTDEAAAGFSNIRGLMQELGVALDGPSPVWNDNESAVKMCADAGSLKRSAYILRRIHFVIELVRSGEFTIKHQPGKKMPADSLTKHLAATVQWLHYHYMGLRRSRGAE